MIRGWNHYMITTKDIRRKSLLEVILKLPNEFHLGWQRRLVQVRRGLVGGSNPLGFY